MPPSEGPLPAEAQKARARTNVEALVERNRIESGIDGPSAFGDTPNSEPVRSAGILGAGMMGTAVAAANVLNHLPTVIADSEPGVLAKAVEKIAAELAMQLPTGAGDARARVERFVEPTEEAARVARCDLVLETVVESLPEKQAAYRQLEPHLSDRTILATNTSTIPIDRLASELVAPERFCGIHFFHPVRKRSLVEVVRGAKVDPTTIAAATAYAQSIGKMPIVVNDGPGFVVNRLLLPYMNEALDMLLDGATLDQIEGAATQFGMAIGPIRILDEIGLDTAWLAGRVLFEAFPSRITPSPLLITLLKQGRLGRKAKAGFFSYANEAAWEGAGQPDPHVEAVIAEWARPPQPFTAEAIVDRLLLSMVLEATRLLEEGRVRDPRDIDLAVLLGLGFPADRGGLLYWADTLGAKHVLDRLGPLEPLGERMRPTQLLLDWAQSGRRWYEPPEPRPVVPSEKT